MGRTEKAILQQAQEQRLPVPQRIQNAPEIGFGLEFYYEAFRQLNTCRPAGMGLCSIPWSAMSQYCDKAGVTGDDFADFVYVIEGLDTNFMKHVNDKQEKENKKPPPPRKVQGPRR